MDRKKLLKKMAIIAIILAVISTAALLFESIDTRSREVMKKRNKAAKISQLTEHYQKFLDATAGKINDIRVSPEIIARIKSEILRKKPKARLFLWMSETTGEFAFGVPAPVFIRMNKIYDKYHNIFEKDGYYVNRDDFLVKLVLKHDEIDFSKFNFSPEKGTIQDWRFFRRSKLSWHDPRTIRLSLSSPVFNRENQILGDLYLVVDDSTLERAEQLFESSFFEGIFEFMHIVFGFSLFFLWVLIPSWVYIDARQRDVKNASKWALLTVVSFGFAALVYSIVRPAGPKSFLCPECHKELNGTKAFCPHCGVDLSSTFCPECQYPLKPEWQFCPNCRFEMTSKPQEEDRTKK